MNRFILSSAKYFTKKPLSNNYNSQFHRQFSSTNSQFFTSSFSTKATLNAPSSQSEHEQLIVIGSGVAGCATALIAAQTYKIPVTLLCAGSNPNDCNSYWAQGGIIYRNYDKSSGDSSVSLIKDVIRAGAGLCDLDAVTKLREDGPDRVKQLLLDDKNGIFANVPFDRDGDTNELSYCLEASHSAPRIIHFADQTGKAITEHITSATASHPLINIIPNTIVTDLITSDNQNNEQPPNTQHRNNKNICIGVQCFDKENGILSNILSSQGVVLASGGLCGLYEHSTNPPGFNALGSSVSLALRAGAIVEDLEYVQFHPTALYRPGEARFLLTEALRGEGAILKDANGYAFAKDFHPDGELAPRDIVARGVYQWLQKTPAPKKNTNRQGLREGHNVYLDISSRDPNWVASRFPAIQTYLQQRGMDLSRDMLPITPAAHYTCGGVVTDLQGRTNVLGLYSAGEAARTGLHGGNRLASTSLLEGLVFGASVADYVGGRNSDEETELARQAISQLLSFSSSQKILSERKEMDIHSNISKSNANAAAWLLGKLRQTMWDNVGVVRTPNGTNAAVRILSEIKEEACELFHESINTETIGLRDAAFAGEAVALAANVNRVSAGAHYVTEDKVEKQNVRKKLNRQSMNNDNHYEEMMVAMY